MSIKWLKCHLNDTKTSVIEVLALFKSFKWLYLHIWLKWRQNLNDWSSSAYRLICFLYSNLRRVASYENYGINLKSCVGVWYSCTLFDVLTLLNPITACLGNKSSSFIVQVSDPRSNAYFIFSTFKWL